MFEKEFEDKYVKPLNYMVEKEYENIMKDAARLLKTINVSEKDKYKLEGVIAALESVAE